MTYLEKQKEASAAISDFPQLYNIEQSVRKLKIGRSFLYKLLHEGKLAKTKIGRRTFISREEVKRFLRACESDTMEQASMVTVQAPKSVPFSRKKVYPVKNVTDNKRPLPTLPVRSKVF